MNTHKCIEIHLLFIFNFLFSLTKNEILKELLHLVVDKPSDDVEDSVKYK